MLGDKMDALWRCQELEVTACMQWQLALKDYYLLVVSATQFI